jgi:hypothetical protein
MKKYAALLALAAGSASAFAPSTLSTGKKSKSSALNTLKVNDLPGAVAPLGFFDPLGFARRADPKTLKRYREAEITHGRVGMLAVVGFLVGEQVAGSSFLFNASVKGPAITHLAQVPLPFWFFLTFAIANAELFRALVAFVTPEKVPVDQPGLMRDSYEPGNLGFDPFNLKPTDSQEQEEMQTKELQNGRVAMLAAAGFMAQELVDGKGIIQHLIS